MKFLVGTAVIWVVTAAYASASQLPIRSGEYTFQLKYEEQPDFPGTPLIVKIVGRHITIINTKQSTTFPLGVIDEGTLTWHAKSKQWIIGDGTDDSTEDVGACTGGPPVIDLRHRIYWGAC